MIKTILIDDERKSLLILQNKLREFCPDIEIIKMIQEPEQALELIPELEPDLVFIDIAMPQVSGFDLLARLDNPNFELIFVTAFSDFAIDAIEHCAIGYLVKPVENEKLQDAVERAVKNIEQKNALNRNQQLVENLNPQSKNKKLIIPVQDGLEFLEFDNIIHLEGDGGYTRIYLQSDKNILSSYRIGHFAKLLRSEQFFQIHKSYIINTKYIKKYLNEGYIVLLNGRKLPVSRSRKNDFLEFIR